MPQADVAASLLSATGTVLVSLLLLLYAVVVIAFVLMVGPIAVRNRQFVVLAVVLLLAVSPGLLWINAGMRSRKRAVAQQRSRKDRLERLAQLNEGEEYDLVQLYQMGAVSPRATGQSITRINAEVQNLTDKKLRVIIRTGTYFISSDIHQNMVTRTEHRFRLHERATERFGVPAACINAESPIPVEDDHFSGVASVSDDLTRFLERAGGEDPMVIQAGVWALTDNYSQYEVRHKLMARSSQGDMRPAISVDQVATAQRILNELGIPNRL